MLPTSFTWLYYLVAVGLYANATVAGHPPTPEQQIPVSHEGGTKWLTPEFDLLVERILDRYKVPGLSIAIVDGEEIHAKGYGIATYPDEKVTPETLFLTASTTKAFTGAAASLLVDDNENFTNVQWTTPISQLIREDFVLTDEYWTNHITLEDALSHRTGMPGHAFAYSAGGSTVQSLVRKLRHLPLSTQPRTTFEYCNLMYVVISHVIESLTGQWFGDFLAERIWKPLGMTSTYFSLQDAQRSKSPLAHGYIWHNETNEYLSLPYFDGPEASGAGNIISNVQDYAKWLYMMIHQKGPLSPAGYEEVLKPRTIVLDPSNPLVSSTNYAFGWGVAIYRNNKLYTHDGGIFGFGSKVTFLPERSFGYVIMANTYETSNMIAAVLGYTLLDQLLEIPQRDRLDWDAQYQPALHTFNHPPTRSSLRECLYPNSTTPTPSLPASLPLSSYAGTYHHPAYLPLSLSLSSSSQNSTSLQGNIKLFSLDATLLLEHLSSDFFILWICVPLITPTAPYQAFKAEAHVDVRGVVDRLGVAFEPALGDQKIWFERVEGEGGK